jgi:hypothetical protein
MNRINNFKPLNFKSMKTTNLFLLAATLVLSFAFTSCEKARNESEPVVASIEDDAVAEDLYNNVFDETGEITQDDVSLKSTSADNGTRVITHVTNGDGSRDITVVYTNWNNPRTHRNNVLNGTILIHEDGNFYGEAYERRVEMQDFFINEIQVKGVKEIVKIAENSFSTKLTGGELIFSDSTTYTREFDYIFTIAEGSGTPLYIWDDVYEVSGTAWGIDRKGRDYTFEIITPLVRNMGWRFLIKGVIDITVDDTEAQLDFGNGEFDNLAYITYNGEVYTIKLGR